MWIHLYFYLSAFLSSATETTFDKNNNTNTQTLTHINTKPNKRTKINVDENTGKRKRTNFATVHYSRRKMYNVQRTMY